MIKCKIFFTSIVIIIMNILGGWDKAIEGLLYCIILDYFTAIILAVSQKKLNSTIGIKGIIKKVGFLVLVAVSIKLGEITNLQFRDTVIYFLIANEIISIIENLGLLGVPIPNFIKEKIDKLKEGENIGE